ncbi:MAG: hypothetical protein IJ760_07415 [Bacteroidales bacterium]|nr:hypothetical protein [Bacteroidales bacterium]
MKRMTKRMAPVLIAAALLLPCCMAAGCASERKSSPANKQEVLYERHQSNKGSKVKSNIKVRGTNKKNRHTTRTY